MTTDQEKVHRAIERLNEAAARGEYLNPYIPQIETIVHAWQLANDEYLRKAKSEMLARQELGAATHRLEFARKQNVDAVRRAELAEKRERELIEKIAQLVIDVCGGDK